MIALASFVSWWQGLRIAVERNKKLRNLIEIRCWGSGYMDGEIAHLNLGWSPLQAFVEFPSDWHESRRVWINLSLLLFRLGVSFRWRGEVVPDQGQCSGPRYGFAFYEDLLWIYHGKDTGRKGDGSRTTYHMPWGWDHVGTDFLWPDGRIHHRAKPGEYGALREIEQVFTYTYVRDNGEVQVTVATVFGQRRQRCMRALRGLPFTHRYTRSIDVQFKPAIGESVNSYKGGVYGCGWKWRRGETMEQALRRMECERRFR